MFHVKHKNIVIFRDKAVLYAIIKTVKEISDNRKAENKEMFHVKH